MVMRAEALAKEAKVTKEVLAGQLGVHPRTITRTMDHYGLDARQWPPQRWPNRQPKRPPRGGGAGHMVASLAATVLFAFGTLDMLVDGHLDGILRFCNFFLPHVSRSL
jgi:hypothetical protein